MTADNMCSQYLKECNEKLDDDFTPGSQRKADAELYIPSQMSHSEQRTKEILSDNQKQPNWPAPELTLLPAHSSLAILIQQVVKERVHAMLLPVGFYCTNRLLSPALCGVLERPA